jgi:hypothetical protein
LLKDRPKYRREVAGRGIDDLQHLHGGGLLRDRFVSLGGAFGELPLEIGDDLLRIR